MAGGEESLGGSSTKVLYCSLKTRLGTTIKIGLDYSGSVGVY
jgi:hypothetical protein